MTNELNGLEFRVNRLARRLEELRTKNEALKQENQRYRTGAQQVSDGPIYKSSESKPATNTEKLSERDQLRAELDGWIDTLDRCLERIHKL